MFSRSHRSRLTVSNGLTSVRWLLLAWIFALCGLTSRARADEVKALRYDLRLDIPLTSAALLGWVGSELLKDELAPSRCRWCESGSLDQTVSDGLRWSNTQAAYRTSNWLGFGLVPLSAAAGMAALSAGNGAKSGMALDMLVIAEAAFLAADLNQLVKYTLGRERPFVHRLDDEGKGQTKHPSDNNLSFYSAHTSISFSVVTAAGTVATMRGYQGAPLVWALGLPLAAFTGYLRIAADRHYLSDVLVGAVLGSAIGVLAPLLLHGPKDSKGSGMSLSASSNALTLTFRN